MRDNETEEMIAQYRQLEEYGRLLSAREAAVGAREDAEREQSSALNYREEAIARREEAVLQRERGAMAGRPAAPAAPRRKAGAGGGSAQGQRGWGRADRFAEFVARRSRRKSVADEARRLADGFGRDAGADPSDAAFRSYVEAEAREETRDELTRLAQAFLAHGARRDPEYEEPECYARRESALGL